MRIVDSNPAANTPVQGDRTDAARLTNPAGNDPAGQQKVQPSSDSVQLSGLSGRVAESLQADSAARAQKVSEVAAAVQSGTYTLDAKAVSKALVDHAISAGNDAKDETKNG